ncbi:hypothetical protein VTL71DRAFT_1845 [Oculimacula yallundae]|uniref:Uncharacterized protein n=1 Tax=Oculimacula yallundae TaxID=86028 RepID=A0ABR4CCD9_9HELO
MLKPSYANIVTPEGSVEISSKSALVPVWLPHKTRDSHTEQIASAAGRANPNQPIPSHPSRLKRYPSARPLSSALHITEPFILYKKNSLITVSLNHLDPHYAHCYHSLQHTYNTRPTWTPTRQRTET